MKKVEKNHLSQTKGGCSEIGCGISVGIAIGTLGNPWAIGAALAFCLCGDTSRG